jgi:hypothetical protein
MSHPPKTLIKSRENLQELFKNPHVIIKYEIFDRVLSRLWGNISVPSSSYSSSPSYPSNSLKSLKYIINLHDPNYLLGGFDFTEKMALELIEILKKEYPGVDFTYKETAGYDGRIIERVIIMDWSV